MVHRLGIACLVLATLVASASAPNGNDAEYSATQISVPTVFRPENQGVAALNDRGGVVVSCGLAASKGASQAYFWQAGKAEPIGTLEGFQSTAVEGISAAAEVVGWCYLGMRLAGEKRPTEAAFVWRRGRMDRLETPEGWSSGANGINDSGDIVGWVSPPSKPPAYGLRRPVIWRAGKRSVLRGIPRGFGEAMAINNRGQIAVMQRDPKDYRRSSSYLWETGKAKDLGSLGGHMTEASALSDRGDVVGRSSLRAKGRYGDEVAHAFLWSGGKMRDLGTLGGEMSYASGVDETCNVVGRSYAPEEEEKKGIVVLPFIWDRESGMRRLDRLTDLGDMASLSVGPITPQGTIGASVAPRSPAVYGTWRAAVLRRTERGGAPPAKPSRAATATPRSTESRAPSPSPRSGDRS